MPSAAELLGVLSITKLVTYKITSRACCLLAGLLSLCFGHSSGRAYAQVGGELVSSAAALTVRGIAADKP